MIFLLFSVKICQWYVMSRLTSPTAPWCPLSISKAPGCQASVLCHLVISEFGRASAVVSSTFAVRRDDGETVTSGGEMLSNVVGSARSTLCVLRPPPLSICPAATVWSLTPGCAPVLMQVDPAGEAPASEDLVHTGLFQPPRWGLPRVSFPCGFEVIHC